MTARERDMIDFDAAVRAGRAVRIEDELARRNVRLLGKANERSGPCPICGGHDRFSVNLKKQVWNCRGCGRGGDTIALVQHLEQLDFGEAVKLLAGEQPPERRAAESKKVVVKRFDYEDENGELLFQVERIEFQNQDGSFVLTDGGKRKKSFRQRRADPHREGQWLYCVDGVRMVPYRLPELQEAIALGHPIVIAEGEHKVDSLRGWNIAATCNTGGAKHWKAEHSAYLRGAEVIIMPDNDQAGRLHCEKCASSLIEAGANVRVLELPGLAPKGDIADWAQAGTIEELHGLIECAPPWRPPRGNGADHDEGSYAPPGEPGAQTLPPAPDRASLRLSAWLDRPIPERDFLQGNVLCTTSRWFVIGETGIGKTLFGGAMGGACAKGDGFLNWQARRPSRVMYIDGELPVETFKERMELIGARSGRDIPFFGYNREDLGFDGVPPLNSDLGKAWLRREIEAIKPDLIIFDSIMCLLVGPMQDEGTWAPVKPLVCELSARKIAQIWFNHANDLGKSFGDKTREWEMDTVAKLSKVEGDETAIRLEFLKARLRTPKTAEQFAPLLIRPAEDWEFEITKSANDDGKRGGDVADIMAEFQKVYDSLADGAPKSFGLDDRSSVLKVSTAAIRDELLERGFLERDEKDNISRVSRLHFYRAKKALVKRGTFAERKKQIWKP